MNNTLPLKRTAIAAVIAMGLLLLGSIVFFKERMLFSDSAYMLFSLLNNGHLMIQESRYGSFITQGVPVLSGLLHLPLPVIMIAYSLSFNLFYFIIIVLLVFRFRQYALAVLMAFYYTLFVSSGFFWPNNEVHQGIAWMFLFFGLVIHYRNNLSVARVGLILVVALLALSSHFIVILPFTFLWVYLWLDKTQSLFSNKVFLRFALFFALVVIFKLLMVKMAGWYDREKLTTVSHFNPAQVFSALTNYQAALFIKLCFTKYWLVTLLFMAGIGHLLFQRRWLLALLTTAYCFSYFLLLCIIFPEETKVFYMESEWMSLSIIATTPFVLTMLPRYRTSLVFLPIAVMFCLRLGFIALEAPVFTHRISMLEDTESKMRQMGVTKMAINKATDYSDRYLMNWGLPVESLLLSAMKGDNPQLTFTLVAEGDTARIPANKNDFLSCFNTLHKNELNPFYFHLDTTTTYRVMSPSELYNWK